MYICRNVYGDICIYVYMYICKCKCICLCITVKTYIDTYTSYGMYIDAAYQSVPVLSLQTLYP